MGVYYRFVNPSLRTWVDPSAFGGIKAGALVAGPGARVWMWLCLFEEGWELVSDSAPGSDLYFDCRDFHDDTARVVHAFVSFFPDLRTELLGVDD